MSASVIIATYGDADHWDKIAQRAIRSVAVEDQLIRIHSTTLACARNLGAQKADCDRLVFLDADDELEPGFTKKILEPEDVLQPKTIYRDHGVSEPASWLPTRNLSRCNYIVVGAPVNRNVFLSSGGFDEYPVAEDWALWLKLRRLGATFGRTEATYIVNVNHQGRNSKGDRRVFDAIRSRYAV